MKLSDYVMQFVAGLGVKHVFLVPGGGAMHLNESLARRKDLEFVCNLHEQASAIAAENYSKATNHLGVALVTTGPGGTNAVTGLAGAWLDSTAVLFLSGQVKRPDRMFTADGTPLGVRQVGVQEVDIISVSYTHLDVYKRQLLRHGHLPGIPAPQRPVGYRRGALEGVGVTRNFWQDRPVLVTGATGLVGSWLTRRLVDAGADVVCLVRDWVPRSELVRSSAIDRVNVVRGDVRDREVLERAIGEYDTDTVIHLAAQTIVGTANRNPVSTFESNIQGAWNVLEACRRSPGVRSIVVDVYKRQKWWRTCKPPPTSPARYPRAISPCRPKRFPKKTLWGTL